MASFEQSLRLHAQPKLLGNVSTALSRTAKRSGAILAFLTLWEVAPRLGLVEPAFLPPFSEVLRTGWQLVRNGQLVDHVSASLSRSLSGFAIASAYAIPLGVAIGWFKQLADILSPLLEVFRNTAALALLPVFLLLLGIGESSKIALVIYSCCLRRSRCHGLLGRARRDRADAGRCGRRLGG